MIEKVKRAMLAMARQCWEQGVAAQAMLELGDMETMRLMARDCVVRQNADGRLCDVENTPAIVDPAVCVEPVLAAGRQLGDQAMIDGWLRSRTTISAHSERKLRASRTLLTSTPQLEDSPQVR